MHTIWKGNISFGLINIGVKLHAAIEDKDIKFNNLHRDTLTPIKQVKVSSEATDKSLKQQDIVKGYEYAANKYVVIGNDEIEELKSHFEAKTVEVIDFIKLEEIDPIYFNKSYYLSPEDGQVRAYSLLRKVLNDTNKIGVAKITIRSNQQLAVIRPYKNAIVLETLHFPDEVRPVENVPNLSEEEVNEKEFAVAKLLIEQLTTPFEPKKYVNEYRSALMTLINAKIEDQNMDTTENKKSESVSLMDILQASLKNTKRQDYLEIDADLNLTNPNKKKKTEKKKASK